MLCTTCLLFVTVGAYVEALYENTIDAHGPGTSFTVLLPPGTWECFYQNLEPEQTLDVEFQVIRGGNLDIDYVVKDPRRKVVLTRSRIANSGDLHTGIDVHEFGDYELCFSNEFSPISSKLVFVSIAVASPMEEGAGMYVGEEPMSEEYTPLLAALDKLQSALYHAKHAQMLLVAHEARDVYLAESNNVMVPFWTLMESVVIVMTSVCQVYTIRQLFVSVKTISLK